MRSLVDIISDAKNGGSPTEEELLYAVCALDSLMIFDGLAIRRLGTLPEERLKAFVERENKERFERVKNAMIKSPKEWLGWEHDPKNPKCLERRKVSQKIYNKVLEEVSKPPEERKPLRRRRLDGEDT